MPISLGIYDVFANLLPGLLYIYAVNSFLIMATAKHLVNGDIFTIEGLFIIVFGCLLGYLLNNFTNNWYTLMRRFFKAGIKSGYKAKSDNENALNAIKDLHPNLKIGFQHKDADLIFNVIRTKNSEVANRIEITRIHATMMQNFSFGLFMLWIVEFFRFVDRHFSFPLFLVALTCLLGSYLALKQTSKYYEWFYKDIFSTAVIYGESVEDIINKIQSEDKSKSKT